MTWPRNPIAQATVFLALALPWLNPFAIGPSPAVVQSLVTLACVALVTMAFSRRMVAVSLAKLSAGAWVSVALISCVIGLLQYFGFGQQLSPWVNPTAIGEAYANLRQRNQFASLTNIGLVALLWWVAHAQSMFAFSVTSSRSTFLRWPFAVPVVAAVVLAIGNAASSSRTGLVQLMMLMAMTWIWGGWRQLDMRSVLVTAILAYGIAAFALPHLAGLDPQATGILARLHDGGPGCSSRMTLWGNVLHLIAQKPWLGWGWGELDFAHFITLYPGPRFCEILDNAHNLPLHLAVELGVPAAVLLGGAGLWLVWRAKPWCERDATRQMGWAVLAVILLHSMLEYPLWYGPFQMAAALCLGLLWMTPPVRSGHTAPAPRSTVQVDKPRVRVLIALGAAFLAAICAYAAWDYHRISQIYLDPKMRSEAYRDNTLEKIGNSWLFQDQVRFAELTTTTLTRDNAPRIHDLAMVLLHFSPEPRVIEKLIESAVMLGRDDEALFYLVRYRAAFPESHARWVAKTAQTRM